MPSKESHLEAAKRNQKTLDYLLLDIENHAPWVATVAFYKGLHLVEAFFATTSTPHTDGHHVRNARLKKNYSDLWKLYKKLWDASLIARYLKDEEKNCCYDDFLRYWPSKGVREDLLERYLLGLEQQVKRLLRPS